MATPRFLADENLEIWIVRATLQIEPAIEFRTARDEGLLGVPDEVILDHARKESLIVVSHDVQTMVDLAVKRISTGASISGLFIVRRTTLPRLVAESIALVWGASSAEEWVDRIVYLPI